MEVAAPMAKATVAIATIAKIGRRRSERTAYLRSKSKVSMRLRAGVERLDIGAVRFVQWGCRAFHLRPRPRPAHLPGPRAPMHPPNTVSVLEMHCMQPRSTP